VKTLVSQGLILQSRIDDAVRRILRIKLKAGLFEHPYADRTYSDQIGSDAHRLVARECVRKSLVLLKKKDNVLPLSKNNIKIHVAGKNADDIGNQCGGWTISWQGSSGNITEGTTVLEAIQNAVESSTVTYSLDGSGAAGSDFAVAVIGETPYAEYVGDRDDLNLSSSDINTVRNLKKEGIPVIVVIISGRPMIIEPILHYSDAIIAVWLPGTEGDGIADILFGDYQPSGLLSYTWPQNMEQIPINFGDSEYSPLYPFGYGLTDLNNSAAGSSPEFSSALAVPDGSQIEVTFNKSMADPSADYSGFIVTINSSSTGIITNAVLKEGDNTTIILSLDQIIEAGDVVKISYNPGNIQSLDGGMLNSFSEKSVYVYANEIEYFTIPGKIEAEDYYAMSGIDTENTSDAGGGLNVGWIDSGDWMEYFLSIPSNGTFKVDFRIASLSEAGQITLKLDDETISTISLPVTGGWQNWQTVSVNCTLTAGIKAFRIIALEGGFNLNWFDISTSTSVIHEGEILSEYMLLQNYPNPFNPATTIKFNIPEFTSVKLAVYDLLGREITVLVNEPLQAGSYNIKFNTEALNLSSGIYLYKLQAGSFSDSKKFVLIK
ncbi:MAG: glycoside hydrolase family 3 C-terminal domain-containing protein, partial [Ignavibacteria bacterium]